MSVSLIVGFYRWVWAEFRLVTIHIVVYSSLIGAGKIILSYFVNISSKVLIYSSNDDYLSEFMTNPIVPTEYTNVTHAKVNIDKYVLICSSSVLSPGVTLHEATAIGLLSLVTKYCEAFEVYIGAPAKKLKIINVSC
tara:strand:- start:18624 stop:19034 length:411 start_codon:yes stop_codon:yes gene_type:complete